MDKIICIAGPTASGKSALAIALAKEFNGEIISCDSMQVYKQMDIGTAKPTPKEMEGIPHHMLSIVEPCDEFSVSRYCEMSDPIIQDIRSRGKTVIIAGGTGLYMDSLIKGINFAPFPSSGQREKLEKIAQEQGIEVILSQLSLVDPESALRLHPSDKKRIIRAMEVYLETGHTITEHNLRTQAIPPKYNPIWLGIDDADRAELYKRIDLRVIKMLDAGLIEEIQRILNSGISEKCTAMQAIGYKEFIDALNGRSSMDEAVELVQKSSRHYAKRQTTWFRRNTNIHWLIRNSGEDNDEIFSRARQFLREFDI